MLFPLAIHGTLYPLGLSPGIALLLLRCIPCISVISIYPALSLDSLHPTLALTAAFAVLAVTGLMPILDLEDCDCD